MEDTAKKREWICVTKDVTINKGEKKVVDTRRHRSGFTLKSKFTQHNFHYTCNLALHKALWRIQSSFLFFFFLNGDKKNLCITTGSLTTPSLYCVFSEPPQFLNPLNSVNLSFHRKRQCIESVAPRQVLAPP